jgi:hypothetical protein
LGPAHLDGLFPDDALTRVSLARQSVFNGKTTKISVSQNSRYKRKFKFLRLMPKRWTALTQTRKSCAFPSIFDVFSGVCQFDCHIFPVTERLLKPSPPLNSLVDKTAESPSLVSET